MQFTVVMTAPDLSRAGRDLLDAGGCRTVFYGGPGEGLADLLERERPDAVISRTLPFGEREIAASPGLRVISRHGVGFDAVDIAAATARGIPVLVADGTNAQAVAEHSFALMLAVARSITRHDGAIREGEWSRGGNGLELSGRTLGLVGYGAIGERVAAIALAFGMRVLAHDPSATRPGNGVTLLGSLEALLARADILSLHCPLTPATQGLLGRRELALLPPGAIVVNTARGGLIDERALAEAISAGRLFGAGLDTFEDEPLPRTHPFHALNEVVMTPHMAGSTDAALSATAESAVRNALSILRDEPVPHRLVVNPDALRSHRRARAAAI